MRILEISPGYFPSVGGVETAVTNLCKGLAGLGVEVEVYATDEGASTPYLNGKMPVRVTRFGFVRFERSRFLPIKITCAKRAPPYVDLAIAVQSNSADIFHVHSVHSLHSLVLLRVRERVLVLTPYYHGPAHTPLRIRLFRLYLPLLSKLLEQAHTIVFASRFERSLIHSHVMFDGRRDQVVPIGVDIEEISRFRWDPERSETRVLFVGRLESYKGVDKLIEAVALLRRRHQSDSFKLVVVGQGPDKARLVDRMHRIRCSYGVEWLGSPSREQILHEYARASVFVLPSAFESYGIAAAEAIAMGVPTVVSNSTALSEFVEAGLAEGVDAPLTREKLADAIFIAHRRGASANPSRVEQGVIISCEEYARRILQLYEQCPH